jgi:hypothetical protein
MESDLIEFDIDALSMRKPAAQDVNGRLYRYPW